jgi:uncharacterized protein (DUF885 family)
MSRQVLILAAALGCACHAAPPVAGTVSPTAHASFAHLVDDYFDAANRYAPTPAVANGFHEYDGQLEDLSRARVEARVAELHGFVERLDRLDLGALDLDERVDATAVRMDALSTLLDFEKVRTWERNPMGYASLPGSAADVLMKRDFAPKKERLRSLIARLRRVPALFAAARANVKNPPRPFTDLAILMAKGSADFLESAVPTWAKDAAGGDAALLAELVAVDHDALTATQDFAAWLEKDLLPRSTGDFALGQELFLEKLRLEEMIDVPLEKLLARGEAQLAKDRAAFVATARLIDPKRPAGEVFARLADDHPSAADLIPQVTRGLEAVRAFVIAHDLITIPSEVRPTVAPTPVYDRGSSFASMETPGPYEKPGLAAYYYVTPVEPEWDAQHAEEHLRSFATPIQDLVDVHEAFPGHYVQFLFGPRVKTKTRKLLGAGSNAEGWAHYTEEMMLEQGFGAGDPKIRLAQLEEALLRDCRYVVGIKEHTQGMSVEEGTRLFVEQCAQERASGFMEARRGTFNPTYLYYTYGKLEIQALRDEYMKAKGASLKQFHDAFVSEGALPLPLVRQLLLR